MATWYCNSSTGNDTTGNGSSGSPYLTISKANSVAAASDTIILQAATATYNPGQLTLVANLTIKASTYGDATLTGSNPRWEGNGTMTVQNLIFSGISMSNDGSNRWPFLTINTSNVNVVWNLTDCKFINHRLTGSYGSMGVFGSQMRKSDVNYKIGDGNMANFKVNTTRVLIDVIATSGDACYVISGLINDAGYTWTVTNTTIYFTYNNAADLICGIVGGGDGTVTFKNSIVYATTAILLENDNWSATATYTDFYQITSSPGGTGNITSDPLFVDAGNDDFRLRPSSPCVNTGTLV